MISGVGPYARTSSASAVRGPAIAVAAVMAALWAWSVSFGGAVDDGAHAGLSDAEAAEISVEHDAFTSTYGLRETRLIEVGRGETLQTVVRRAGATPADTAAVIAGVSTVWDPGRLRPGQKINLYFESTGEEPRLKGVAFRSQPGAAVTVNRSFDERFHAREVLMPLTFEVAHITARIEKTLYDSAISQGATDREVRALGEIFAFDIDFQRDIYPGDGVELVFERFRDDEGRTVKTGEMSFVALTVRNRERRFYRFKAPGQAVADWYDETGKSARKFLMKTPINGARLSSGFGRRKHPILGYSTMHKGVDFAAPSGTPVMAAGDGKVMRAGPNGGYGNYVRIRHSDGYETAYAHLSRFARGVRSGGTVRQGQVIGYVGSTGRSTGPHLHYEVLLRGAQINPNKLKAQTGRNLAPGEMGLFAAEMARIDAIRARSQQGDQAAAAEQPVAAIVPAGASVSAGAAPIPGLRGGF